MNRAEVQASLSSTSLCSEVRKNDGSGSQDYCRDPYGKPLSGDTNVYFARSGRVNWYSFISERGLVVTHP
jgi:hypothetical protein